jgi:hypothetical protein
VKKLEPIMVTLAIAFAVMFPLVWLAETYPTASGRHAFGIFCLLDGAFVICVGCAALVNGKVV